MVVLAAAVCTKSGKALVTRLFVDMSRVRLEGLLASFPKLMGFEKQHTFIETDSVRYLYQPIESLYMLVITNKHSNIVEDLDTLHIMAKLVPEYCRSANEDEIMNNAFELIFAFDEVISLGHKENVTLSQIKTFLEMDSHDEKVHEILERNKLQAAITEAKRRQQQIEKEKAETARSGMGGMGGGMGGMGGGMGGMGSGSKMPGMGSGGMSSMGSQGADPYVVKSAAAERPAPPAAVTKKGMVLGKASKANDLLKQLVDEGEIEEPVRPTPGAPASAASSSSAPTAAAAKREPIHLTIEEKIVAVTEYDGGLQNLEIKGDLSILITDPNVANIRMQLNNDYDKAYQFRTHPHIDKGPFTKNNIIGLKDTSRAFPTNTPLGVLKWRFQTKDESLMPLTVNCWPSKGSAGSTVVNMEYELVNKNMELRDVSILIPIPGGHPPVVNNADGHYQFENKRQALNWSLTHIDQSNDTGSMEFTIPYNGEKYALFPIIITFNSTKTLSGVQVVAVNSTEGPKVPFSSEVSLSTESYQLVYKA